MKRPALDLAASDAPNPRTLGEWLNNRLALRLDEIAKALGVCRRTIEKERSAGRFPPPDLHIGKLPLWCPETIRAWIARGGAA